MAERGALSFFAATAMDPPLLAAGVLSHADGRLKNGVNMLATGCELVSKTGNTARPVRVAEAKVERDLVAAGHGPGVRSRTRVGFMGIVQDA